MNDKPKRVKAKSVQSTNKHKNNNREIWATVCYYYPQYTLKEASELSSRDIKLLIRIAERKQAENYFNLTQIATAPHTKKGSGVKKLTKHFQELMNK